MKYNQNKQQINLKSNNNFLNNHNLFHKVSKINNNNNKQYKHHKKIKNKINNQMFKYKVNHNFQ